MLVDNAPDRVRSHAPCPIKRVRIRGRMDDNSLEQFAQSLPTTVEEIQLTRPELSASGVNRLISILENTTTSLHKLSLVSSDPDIFSSPLFRALSSSSLQLKTLTMSMVRITDVAALEVMLKTNTTLKKLQFCDMRGNNDILVDSVCRGLQVNATLKTLRLGGLQIRDTQAQSLAQLLLENTALQSLDLGFTSLGDTGVTALAKALETNTTLLTLALNNNPNIAQCGAYKLGMSLPHMKGLRTLDLLGLVGSNVKGELLVRSLFRGLLSNCHVENQNCTRIIWGQLGASSLGWTRPIQFLLGGFHQRCLRLCHGDEATSDGSSSLLAFVLERIHFHTHGNADVLYYYIRNDPSRFVGEGRL